MENADDLVGTSDLLRFIGREASDTSYIYRLAGDHGLIGEPLTTSSGRRRFVFKRIDLLILHLWRRLRDLGHSNQKIMALAPDWRRARDQLAGRWTEIKAFLWYKGFMAWSLGEVHLRGPWSGSLLVDMVPVVAQAREVRTSPVALPGPGVHGRGRQPVRG